MTVFGLSWVVNCKLFKGLFFSWMISRCAMMGHTAFTFRHRQTVPLIQVWWWSIYVLPIFRVVSFNGCLDLWNLSRSSSSLKAIHHFSRDDFFWAQSWEFFYDPSLSARISYLRVFLCISLNLEKLDFKQGTFGFVWLWLEVKIGLAEIYCHFEVLQFDKKMKLPILVLYRFTRSTQTFIPLSSSNKWRRQQ